MCRLVTFGKWWTTGISTGGVFGWGLAGSWKRRNLGIVRKELSSTFGKTVPPGVMFTIGSGYSIYIYIHIWSPSSNVWPFDISRSALLFSLQPTPITGIEFCVGAMHVRHLISLLLLQEHRFNSSDSNCLMQLHQPCGWTLNFGWKKRPCLSWYIYIII